MPCAFATKHDHLQTGLKGCGLKIARGLAKYGLGNLLYDILAAHTGKDLLEHLATWRERLKVLLRTDPRGYIGHTYPSLARAVDDRIPNVKAARKLLHPALLEQTAYETLPPPRPLELAQIARFCEMHFSFGSCAELLCALRKTVWPDEALRMLISEGLARVGKHVEVSIIVSHSLHAVLTLSISLRSGVWSTSRSKLLMSRLRSATHSALSSSKTPGSVITSRSRCAICASIGTLRSFRRRRCLRNRASASRQSYPQ